MKNSALLRSVGILSALSAALAANAVSIAVGSAGVVTSDGVSRFYDEAVTSQVGGLGAFTTLHWEFAIATGLGAGSYTGPGGTLNFSLDDKVLVPPSGNSLIIGGNWTYTSGTGTYKGLSGQGTYSANITLLGDPPSSMTVFGGTVNPVPEPATMSVLALGGLGLLRRRRRKA